MPQKPKAAGGGVGPHVRALRGKRTDFEPDVLKTVVQFLVMLNKRYVAAAATQAGRHGQLNSAIRHGMHKRYSALADAALVFVQDATSPWSRFSWSDAEGPAGALVDGLAAADRILRGIDPDWTLGDHTGGA